MARGTDGADSDIDLLLDLSDDVGGFASGRLRRDLRAAAPAGPPGRVDAIGRRGTSPTV